MWAVAMPDDFGPTLYLVKYLDDPWTMDVQEARRFSDEQRQQYSLPGHLEWVLAP